MVKPVSLPLKIRDMTLEQLIQDEVIGALELLYGIKSKKNDFQATRKDFEGDITLVTFALAKEAKKRPDIIAEEIGAYLRKHVSEVVGYNVVKGFLNISISDTYFVQFFDRIREIEHYGTTLKKDKGAILVEFSSPNTNKPLHLGHVRNNLLGYSVSNILEANGHKVYKTQIINDRGIHICKSMLMWKRYGRGETPESADIKGDAFVGRFYIMFDKIHKEEVTALVEKGRDKKVAEQRSPIMLEAKELLRKWEAGDPETVELWKRMNGWVYKGFEKTYKDLGVYFDSYYYESETYLLGKEYIELGLRKGVFYRKRDGSIWCDLTEEGLDEKL